MLRAILLGAVLASCLSGCAGDRSIRCEDPSRYAGSGSIPPVRVPDDLSPPDEAESLRIPPTPQERGGDREAERPCLESPPEYFPQGVERPAEEAPPGS